jgi:hypothetical protein
MQGVKLEVSPEAVRSLASRLSDTAAAKELGVAVSSFFLLRKRYGIPSFTQSTGCRRSLRDSRLLRPGEGVRHPQHLSLRVDCFDAIDSPEKAYYLGLLAADGHVNLSPKGKYVSIELQEPDAVVLEGLERLLGCSGKIRRMARSGKKPSRRLLVHSRELAESLFRQGITLSTEEHWVPAGLPAALRPHCLRGLLDGDGHICFRKKSLYLCSCSLKLIEVVQGWVSECLGIEAPRRSRILPSRKLFHCLTFGGRPRNVLEWAYGSGGVAIPRKKAEADLWLSRFE